jgi:hypothetical protein
MKAAISQLYAHIILFFRRAVKWYRLGPASRAFASIIKPFSLEFKDTVEQIRLCSKKVEGIAKGAERAELRDVHITVQRGFGDIETRLQEMQAIQAATDARIDTVLQVALSTPYHDHPGI